jgi:hypothetical protein
MDGAINNALAAPPPLLPPPPKPTMPYLRSVK